MSFICVHQSWYLIFSLALTPPAHQQSPPYPAGTLFYMSPEQLSGKKYDRKVDMFALGVILTEMYCPFQTDMERFEVGAAMIFICVAMILHT